MRRTLPSRAQLLSLVSPLLWTLAALFVWMPSTRIAVAQDAPDAPVVEADQDENAELVDTGSALLQHLSSLRERTSSLTARAVGREGEERQIVERRAMEAKLEYVKVFEELVDNLVAQEAAGLVAPDVRALVESELQRLPQTVGTLLDEATERLRSLRTERDALDIPEQPAVDQQVARTTEWISDLLEAYTGLTDEMTAVGMDAGAARADALARSAGVADSLVGHIQLIVERRDMAARRAEDAPDDATIQREITILDARRSRLAESLTRVAKLIDALGGDSNEYRQMLQMTGPITTDILDEGVLLGVIEVWGEQAGKWITVNGSAIAFDLIAFVSILLAFRVIAAIVRRLLLRRLHRKEGTKPSLKGQMIEAMTVRTIMLIGLLVGISQMGYELGPLLAGFGIAGFIVGFALQDTLSNFAAGAMILLYRPFDVGDTIESAGVMGSVSHMTLVSTTILTIDNQTLIVPNSKIWGNVIRNVTRQAVRRIDLKFKIAYTEDLERMEKIFMGIIVAHPQTLEDPPPRVSLHEMGEYAMEIIVRPWVPTTEYWPVYWELMRTIKLRLDAEGIDVPLPGREVHVRGDARATRRESAAGGT